MLAAPLEEWSRGATFQIGFSFEDQTAESVFHALETCLSTRLWPQGAEGTNPSHFVHVVTAASCRLELGQELSKERMDEILAHNSQNEVFVLTLHLGMRAPPIQFTSPYGDRIKIGQVVYTDKKAPLLDLVPEAEGAPLSVCKSKFDAFLHNGCGEVDADNERKRCGGNTNDQRTIWSFAESFFSKQALHSASETLWVNEHTKRSCRIFLTKSLRRVVWLLKQPLVWAFFFFLSLFSRAGSGAMDAVRPFLPFLHLPSRSFRLPSRSFHLTYHYFRLICHHFHLSSDWPMVVLAAVELLVDLVCSFPWPSWPSTLFSALFPSNPALPSFESAMPSA